MSMLEVEWEQEREWELEEVLVGRREPGTGARPAEVGPPAAGEEGWVTGWWRGTRMGRETWWWQQQVQQVQRWRQRGSVVGSSPVAPQVVVVEREGTEGGGGSERARRKR